MYRVLIAAGIAALSSAASAKDGRGAQCWLNDGDHLKIYYTGALAVNAPGVDDYDAGRALAQEIGGALAAYIQQSYGINANPKAVGCRVRPSIAQVKTELEEPHDRNLILTGWVNRTATLTESEPKDSEGAGKKVTTAGPKAVEKAEKESPPAGPTAAELAAERHRAVEERNRAAQAQYEAELAVQQRKVAEFNRLMAEMERKKAEQQAAAQSALDSFKAEQAAHAEQMQRYRQEVSDYQAKLAGQQAPSSATGAGGRFKATSAIVPTREQAMAGLMAQRLPGPLTDVQCAEVTMYSPPRWTCWGYYQTEVKSSEASAQ
jgi:hypothetical protein